MFHTIRKTITTSAGGAYTFTTTNKFTGKFIGFHTKVGTMTNCTFTISGLSTHGIATVTRTLYSKAATADTDSTIVMVQAVDTAGSLIAGVYDYICLMNEAVKITIAAGGNAKTMDIEIILDVERPATN